MNGEEENQQDKAKEKAKEVVSTVSDNEKVQGVVETLKQANQQLWSKELFLRL